MLKQTCSKVSFLLPWQHTAKLFKKKKFGNIYSYFIGMWLKNTNPGKGRRSWVRWRAPELRPSELLQRPGCRSSLRCEEPFHPERLSDRKGVKVQNMKHQNQRRRDVVVAHPHPSQRCWWTSSPAVSWCSQRCSFEPRRREERCLCWETKKANNFWRSCESTIISLAWAMQTLATA